MMRWNSFGRTIVFGALAAAGLVVASALLVPPLPWRTLLSLYFAATAVLYVAAIAPSRRRALAAGLGAGSLGALLLLLAGGPGQVALGAALIVAVCRSALLYRTRRGRALAIEGGLMVSGLLLARALAHGGVGSIALGLWAFFLVQSLFFLVGGVRERTREAEQTDPFDQARSRLLRLLEDEGV